RGTANALVLDDGGVNGCTAPGDATNGLKVNVTTAALPPGAALDATLLSMYAGSAQYRSAALEAVGSVKATAGMLNSFGVYNSGLVKCYLQIHNLAAAPVLGNVPWFIVGEVDTGEAITWPEHYQLSTGIQLALSTTLATYTSPGAVGQYHAWRD
ncbi:MAG: hypothetical protein WDA27_14610, partial [Actinomycetota bacterium]